MPFPPNCFPPRPRNAGADDELSDLAPLGEGARSCFPLPPAGRSCFPRPVGARATASSSSEELSSSLDSSSLPALRGCNKQEKGQWVLQSQDQDT